MGMGNVVRPNVGIDCITLDENRSPICGRYIDNIDQLVKYYYLFYFIYFLFIFLHLTV